MECPNGLSAAVNQNFRKLDLESKQTFINDYEKNSKSLGIAYALCFCFGLHLIYFGRVGAQIGFWLTLGGCCIWWLMDIFTLPKKVRQHNDNVALNIIASLTSMK